MSLKLFRRIGIAGILFLAMMALMKPVKTEAADAMWTAKYWNNPTLSGDPVFERTEAEINYDWGDGSPAKGFVNSENFSVYWRRSINFSSGTYRFTATMDDGMRVWVDGSLIIDSWWDSQVHSMSQDLFLNAGDHTVEVRYYDVGAKAVAKLSWAAVGSSGNPAPITNWRGEYFNNKSLSGAPVLVRDDPQIDFDWGTGSPAWNVVAADQFSVRWTRTVSFQPGRYRFTVIADDGVRFWVNGQLVVDKWLDSIQGTYFAELDLSGSVSMQMEYYENLGGAVAKLAWIQLTGGGTSSAWSGQYFNNKNLSGSPALTRNDASINFDWGSGSPAAGTVNSDNFSVRWSRNLSMTAGRYRFTVAVDDGARLWVNNALIIDQWKDQQLTTYSAEIELPTGSIPVRMEYYDATGGAHAHLSWTTVGVTINNWRGEYYNNASLSGGPAVIRDDASVDFNWGNSSPNSGVSSDNFSVRWTRTIVLPAGRYRFTTRTDDGARLWVNNQLLIDRWYPQSLTTAEAEIELYGGPISIKMEYFDNTGLAEAHLSWTQLTNPPTGGSGQGGVGTATVASTLLNVRQGPAVTYPIITTLSRGTVVQLGGYRNATTTWVMLILPSGQQGWSYAPFLTTSYNLASLPVWTPPGGTPSGPTATVVGAYHLNVRSGPGVSFAPIMTIPRGTVVQLVGRNSSSTWLKIQMPSGTQGWSNASYLQTTYAISSLPVLTS